MPEAVKYPSLRSGGQTGKRKEIFHFSLFPFTIHHSFAAGMEADSPGWPEPMWSQQPAATAGSSTEAVAEHGLGNTGYERTARPAAQNIPIKKSVR